MNVYALRRLDQAAKSRRIVYRPAEMHFWAALLVDRNRDTGDCGGVIVPCRERDRNRLDRIAVDDEVERGQAEAACQSVERKVFDPDPGMVQIGLMTRGDHGADRPFFWVVPGDEF